MSQESMGYPNSPAKFESGSESLSSPRRLFTNIGKSACGSGGGGGERVVETIVKKRARKNETRLVLAKEKTRNDTMERSAADSSRMERVPFSGFKICLSVLSARVIRWFPVKIFDFFLVFEL